MHSNIQTFHAAGSWVTHPLPVPYPLLAFPIAIRSPVEEIMRNIQGPVPMIALSAITAMSAVCQPLIKVKLPTGQISAGSINTATVAESGERKTATDKITMGPLYTADAVRIKEFEEGVTDHLIRVQMWEAKLTAIRRKITSEAMKSDNPKSDTPKKTATVAGDDAIELTDTERDEEADSVMDDLHAELSAHMRIKPKRQKLRRTVRQEITPRAMMEALQGDGESIVLNSEEGDMLLNSGALSSMGLLNKLWDGPDILAFDRAQFDSIVVRNPRVSVSFMVQSAVLEKYIECRGKVMRGSGQWARYLIAWPESTQGFRVMSYTDPTWTSLPGFHARMQELVAEYEQQLESGQVRPEVLEFDDDARVAYVNLQNGIEPMLRPMHYLHDIKDFASKATEMVGRLAAQFHKFSKQEGKISLDTFNRSWAIVEWHLHEFKRIFSPPTVPQEIRDAGVLEHYLHANYWCRNAGSAQKNLVLRYGPIRPAARLDAALNVLIHSNRVWITIGQRRERYITFQAGYFASLPPPQSF